MKRLVLYSLPFLLLACSLFASTASAQRAPLPDDERFDAPISLTTRGDGEELSSVVAALASVVQLTPIVDDVPDDLVRFDIRDPKPFRQVWNIVLGLHDLDYLLLENDVIVVGTEASVARFREQERVAEVDPDSEVVQRFYRVFGRPDDIATLLREAVPQVDVTVIGELDTLSVRGTETQQERVTETLDQFDRPVEEVALVQRVYTLSHARAEDLAEVLQESGVTATINGQAENGENGSRDERLFTVVAEPRTNSLIITASAVLQDRIAELIEPLDMAQPQVNVQVRIQEISRRSASNLGIDLNAGIGSFATEVLGGGLNFVFDSQRALTGLNIGAVLDTLETQGLSRSLDDSTLTMLNNRTGRLNSGGRIEITFPGEDGQVQERTLEFGVIIEVTPQIAADGSVILEVVAEVSDLLTPFGEGGIPQRIDFTTREVSSTVSLQPGQTALLGGLLQNSFTQTVRRTPVLGSIPLIGELFRSTVTEEDSTDLLLVVTADVLD